MTLTLGLLPIWAVSLLVAIFLFACVVMMLTVLIQRPQGGGLSGAFGSGGGAGQTAFGTKTGDALTIATIVMFVVFLGLAVGLNYATRPENIATGQPVAQSADNGQGDGTTDAEGTTTVDQPTDQPAETPAAPEAPAGDDSAAESPATDAPTADAPAGEPETGTGDTGAGTDDTTTPGEGTGG